MKIPWELFRFQHLNLLGQAYILTGDKKYAEGFANQIGDWMRKNPVYFGVTWKCTMDVAIRAANWLVDMEHFADIYSETYGHVCKTSWLKIRARSPRSINGHMVHFGWCLNGMPAYSRKQRKEQ